MGKPFSHIDEHFQTRAIEREFEEVPATRAAKEDWEKVLDLEREDEARSHYEAAYIMQDFSVTRRPFVLFLRSFEAEAYNYLTPEDGPGERKVFTTGAGINRVEEKLASALAGRLKAISVANPAQLLTSRAALPRLALPNEGWEAVVENVIQYAHFIVMDLSTVARGVLKELEIIRGAKRQSDTIVILPSASEPDRNSLRKVAELLGAVAKEHPQPTKNDPELAGFARVAGEDEIAFDRLDDSPLFSDLLASATAAAAAAPPFDAVALARDLSNEGVALFNDKQYAQAMNLYVQAMVLRRCVNDRSGLLTSLLNIGSLYADVGQAAEALASFEEGLPLARELDRPADEGLLTSYIGMAYKQLGEFHKAKQWLASAFPFQVASGEAQDVENTLSGLYEVFETLRDGDGMVLALGELRAYHRRRGDQAGELRDTLLLGRTYHLAGRPTQAQQLFQEGVRLSLAVGDSEREEVCRAMLARLAAEPGIAGEGKSVQ